MKSAASKGNDAVLRFVAAAKDFCKVVKKKHYSKRAFVKHALRGVVAVYAAGLELPNRNAGELPKRLGYDVYADIRDRAIANLNGEDLHYWEVFDPFDLADGPLQGGIPDDLADIYCDLQVGLVTLRDSPVPSDAVIWQWKFGLESHWGRHAVGAIAALHALATRDL